MGAIRWDGANVELVKEEEAAGSHKTVFTFLSWL